MLPLFGCLKDSCEIADTLLNDFKEAEGYELLTDAILNVSSSYRDFQVALHLVVLSCNHISKSTDIW